MEGNIVEQVYAIIANHIQSKSDPSEYVYRIGYDLMGYNPMSLPFWKNALDWMHDDDAQDDFNAIAKRIHGDDKNMARDVVSKATDGLVEGLVEAFGKLEHAKARCMAILDTQGTLKNALRSSMEHGKGVDFFMNVWFMRARIKAVDALYWHVWMINALERGLNHIKHLDDDRACGELVKMANDLAREVAFEVPWDYWVICSPMNDVADHWRFLKRAYRLGFFDGSDYQNFRKLYALFKDGLNIKPLLDAPKARRLASKTLGCDKRKCVIAPLGFTDFVSPVVMDQGEDNLMVMDEGEIYVMRVDETRMVIETF
jgi:hypothetical protein